MSYRDQRVAAAVAARYSAPGREPVAKIAREFGISPATVISIASDANCKMRGRARIKSKPPKFKPRDAWMTTREQRDRMAALYDERRDLTCREIAASHGV